MSDAAPDRLNALMADLLPPGTFGREAVRAELVADIGPIFADITGRTTAAVMRLGARIGVELLLHRLAPWLTPILLDSHHSAAEIAAGPNDHVEDVLALIDVLTEAGRPGALHEVTRAILEGEGG